jgi:hypothetical protein
MRSTIAPVFFVVSFLLAGCASGTREGMSKSTRNEEVVLAEPVSIFAVPGIGGRARLETRAAAGVYRAEREDAQGIYFFGEGRPILRKLTALSDGRLLQQFTSEGGIFLPKDSAAPPRFFTILETRHPDSKSSEQAAVQLGVQNAVMPPAGASPGMAAAGAAIGVAAVGAMVYAASGQVVLNREIENAMDKAKIYAGRHAIVEENPPEK